MWDANAPLALTMKVDFVGSKVLPTSILAQPIKTCLSL